jgi:hypothetical protein
MLANANLEAGGANAIAHLGAYEKTIAHPL